MNGNLSPSLIRTLVPFLVGPLVTRYGIDPNDPELAIIFSALIGYGYYVLARLLEVFGGAKWGYILGLAKAPGYEPGSPVQPAPVGEPDAGRGTLGLIGLVLAVVGAIVLLLILLDVIAASVSVAVIALVIGVVLLLVDGNGTRV